MKESITRLLKENKRLMPIERERLKPRNLGHPTSYKVGAGPETGRLRNHTVYLITSGMS